MTLERAIVIVVLVVLAIVVLVFLFRFLDRETADGATAVLTHLTPWRQE